MWWNSNWFFFFQIWAYFPGLFCCCIPFWVCQILRFCYVPVFDYFHFLYNRSFVLNTPPPLAGLFVITMWTIDTISDLWWRTLLHSWPIKWVTRVSQMGLSYIFCIHFLFSLVLTVSYCRMVYYITLPQIRVSEKWPCKLWRRRRQHLMLALPISALSWPNLRCRMLTKAWEWGGEGVLSVHCNLNKGCFETTLLSIGSHICLQTQNLGLFFWECREWLVQQRKTVKKAQQPSHFVHRLELLRRLVDQWGWCAKYIIFRRCFIHMTSSFVFYWCSHFIHIYFYGHRYGFRPRPDAGSQVRSGARSALGHASTYAAPRKPWPPYQVSGCSILILICLGTFIVTSWLKKEVGSAIVNTNTIFILSFSKWIILSAWQDQPGTWFWYGVWICRRMCPKSPNRSQNGGQQTSRYCGVEGWGVDGEMGLFLSEGREIVAMFVIFIRKELL